MPNATLFLTPNVIRQQNVCGRMASETGMFSGLRDRKRIKALLSEAEAAGTARQAADGELARLDGELDALVEKHQAATQAIQAQLLGSQISVKERLALQEKLQQLNSELQASCDAVNAKIAAKTAERDEHFIVESRGGQLRAALRNTCPPDLLAKHQAGQQFAETLRNYAKSCAKALAEAKALVGQPERYSAGTLANMQRHVAVAEHLAELAGKCHADAMQQVAALRLEIES